MAGGGKGGTKSQEIDPGLTAAARDALDFAAASAAVPYSPNMGVQFAAFTPQQQAAFQGANSAATAFGLPSAGPTSMPKPQTSASGIQGYSTAADYQQIKNQSMSSGLQAALDALFADRTTRGASQTPQNGGVKSVNVPAKGATPQPIQTAVIPSQFKHLPYIQKLMGGGSPQPTPSPTTGAGGGGGKPAVAQFAGPSGPLYRGRYAAMPGIKGGGK